MANENGEERNEERKGDTPVFERRLKDLRVACWKNQSEGRPGFMSGSPEPTEKGDDLHEAAGSLNGLPDIALAIAGLQAVQQFIERQPEV